MKLVSTKNIRQTCALQLSNKTAVCQCRCLHCAKKHPVRKVPRKETSFKMLMDNLYYNITQKTVHPGLIPTASYLTIEIDVIISIEERESLGYCLR